MHLLEKVMNAHEKLLVLEGRLEEAKWWIGHLEIHGDEILQSDHARVKDLETMVQKAKTVAMEAR